MTPLRKSITVFAPATVANVGSAFDVLGFALEAPGDTVTAYLSPQPGIRIRSISGDQGKLSHDVKRNTAGVSSQALLSFLQNSNANDFSNVGIELVLNKGLPIGSGLGSSSASTVAAVVATNELLGAPLSRKELLPFAMEGERVACGAAHADNVAPCLLGGFVLVRSYDPLDIIPLPSPEGIWVAVVTPSVEVKTVDARKVLKRSIPLEAAISQWGNVAALVAAIYRNDIHLMGRALEDKIVEPERAPLIPGYHEAKLEALRRGALGCSISGSGPSVFALCESREGAESVSQGMIDSFLTKGIQSTQSISRINSVGATILSQEPL